MPAEACRLIETAALMALDCLADQRPNDEWHDELHDQALVSLALADQGIGPEVRPLAQSVLTMLQADRAGELLPMARDLVRLVAQQLRLATVGQFYRARQQALDADTHRASAPPTLYRGGLTCR